MNRKYCIAYFLPHLLMILSEFMLYVQNYLSESSYAKIVCVGGGDLDWQKLVEIVYFVFVEKSMEVI
jgi:hypothetical protein